MNINIAEKQILDDGSTRLYIELLKNELVLFAYIFESMEGYCNFTTVRRGETLNSLILSSGLALKNKSLLLPKKGGILLQMDIPPDFLKAVNNILEYLAT